ncbi:hypothetical protein O181_065156 [Austropuccinia psidii MF-1]|uniref:Uncharacterized protein n=1 Tax=Austropuccinia psidii MF-1 TaxID=1389203 RepID=A0A9Q3EV37_9BASI|nr:hypothetical protein [Austropuccinia psidii MF-1]
MPQTPGNSTEFNEQRTSAPESGSEISDMVSSHELSIEVESQSHENNQDPPVLQESQPPSSQKPNFKSYEKEKNVEPCAPTEYAGKDDITFSGKVEIISKEQFVSNITQRIPRLEKIQNDSKITDYVCQKIADAMSLLKMDLKCVEVGESLPEGSLVVIGALGKGLGKRPDINATKKPTKNAIPLKPQKIPMINVEVDHIDNEPLHTESLPYSMKQSMMKPLLPLLEIFKPFKIGRQLNRIKWVMI